MVTLQDRIRGSLIGGAIGDALGYPVEFFFSYERIQARYGERGITRFDREYAVGQDGKAAFSDDTQMTLFTANGLLNAKRMGLPGTVGIRDAYVEWYLTQTGYKSFRYNDCWIASLPALNKSRAPGTTCMSALEAVFQGRIPKNDSMGCGGVMRIAPVPLYAIAPKITDSEQYRISIEDADLLAGDAARITHKHPLGYIPAALMSHVIYRLACDPEPTRETMKHYIQEGADAMNQLYGAFPKEVKYMAELTDLVVRLANNDKSDVENIGVLGEGWTGDEALVIALYCALKHFDSFEEAVIAAVNHAGDSDSTGAVMGNILGAAIGYEAIPQFFKDDLEMQDLILHMADDLFRGEVTKM